MKDYYRILGVLDDAEDIIIRASYKALAQRYHPDKWKGDKEEANKKMQDINEPYETLSDTNKRKKYDEEYFKYRARDEASENEEQSNEYEESENEYDETWKMATEFYPIIRNEYEELRKISLILANTFKNSLISNQEFKKSTDYKNKYEKDYLSRYYGSDPNVQLFVKKLLINNFSKAAIQVNKIVRFMGDSVNHFQVQSKIFDEFPDVKVLFFEEKTNANLKRKFENGMFATEDYLILFKRYFNVRIEVTYRILQSDTYNFIFEGKKYSLSTNQFINFVHDKFLKFNIFR